VLLGVFERIADAPLYAVACADFNLIGDLVLRTLVKESSLLRIQAFSVLAHDDHVDAVRLRLSERAWHARQQFCGSKVDVLIQLETQLQQYLGFDNSLWNLCIAARVGANRPEKDRIMRRQLLQR